MFRLVAEVTSSDMADDLRRKPLSYAQAAIPVYVIIDRTNRRVLVLSDPRDGEYRVQAVYHPGQSVTLPASIGVEVTFEVDYVLGSEKPQD
ncbi:Uma2 family endonuclease [Kitasatospora sp. NPDC006697]|uniref:Uma2 family endonuclease n=1 Tax=Kitasatospora sp. NPDC006697 TaxID=3364020 RepID=UPI0036ABF891